jgi:hypothetical protein
MRQHATGTPRCAGTRHFASFSMRNAFADARPSDVSFNNLINKQWPATESRLLALSLEFGAYQVRPVITTDTQLPESVQLFDLTADAEGHDKLIVDCKFNQICSRRLRHAG